MLKNIRVNNDCVEMMIFFWESVVSRDKVQDSYFAEVANKPEMEVLYGEDFTKESVRKVLSAINNRELLNGATKKESRFWNNNMWMTEDIGVMREMVDPIKHLNLDDLYGRESKYEEVEVRFIPGHEDVKYVKDNVITINFFKVIVDIINGGPITIEGKEFYDYVLESVISIL